jgi:hypothetical protein
MTPDEETRHLEAAEVELRNQFPNIPAQRVHEAIEAEHKSFERAPIRDYVPLLVARDVRAQLRQGARA